MKRILPRAVDKTSQTTISDEDRCVLASRRDAATRLVGAGTMAGVRIATAPAGYLLAHPSSDIARHSVLLSSLPSPGEARVVVTPGRITGDWHLDVASRDRPGLLAAFTGVLARGSIDVVRGVLATWDDGAALEAFIVRSGHPPDPHALQSAMEASLDAPLSSPPVADARFTFDGQASRLYTSAEIVAADRPGLLHAFAVAIATAGAHVHAACVGAIDGLACDHFDLSDPLGHKVGAPLEKAIRTAVLCGVPEAAATLRRRTRDHRNPLVPRRNRVPAGHR